MKHFVLGILSGALFCILVLQCDLSMAELKPIEDAIVDSIDKSEWHGVHTWGKALYGC